MAKNKIRVMIVEDHPETAYTLRQIFEEDRDFTLTGVYPDVRRTSAAVNEADVAIVDIKLPDGSGIDLIAVLRKRLPHIKILMYTAIEEGPTLLKAMGLGASGYLLKGTPASQIPDHVRVAAQGGVTFSPKIAEVLLGLSRKRPEAEILTERETDVLRQLALGFTSGEIAGKLEVSAATVRKHLENIYRKLDVKSRSGAILFGIESGILRRP
jgi:DNA-binding NarL/FixJ family response regulator